MDLFSTLEKKQKFTFFNAGSENRFFLSHGSILNTYANFKALSRAQKPFDIIRANVVIRSLLNKQAIEDAFLLSSRQYRHNGELDAEGKAAVVAAVEEAKKGLPYLVVGEKRIYVPTLPKSLNEIYGQNILRLEEKPSKPLLSFASEALMIDPFDTYGWPLFDSYFTNLILVRAVDKTAAMFDYDSLSIYFINYEGRLDAQISLFDRYIGKRTTNHMMERIVPVVDAYFRDDREGLIQNLVQNQLISSRLIYKINMDEHKRLARLDKLAER